MPTGDYKIELFVEVEFVYHPAVREQPMADVMGEDAYIELLSVYPTGMDTSMEHDLLARLPSSIRNDIKEHFLKGELAGPDPDGKHDERGG